MKHGYANGDNNEKVDVTKGNPTDYEKQLTQNTGKPTVTAAAALVEALKVFSAKKIAHFVVQFETEKKVLQTKEFIPEISKNFTQHLLPDPPGG